MLKVVLLQEKFSKYRKILLEVLNIEVRVLQEVRMAEADRRAASKETNVESSKVNASRQGIIKKLSKSFLPESKFSSKLGKLSDTNLGSFNLEAFRRRMMGIGGHHPSVTSHNIVRSGLYAATGFPPAIQCPELIMECANCYNSK